MTYINYTSPTTDRSTKFRGTPEACGQWLSRNRITLEKVDAHGGKHYANGTVIMPIIHLPHASTNPLIKIRNLLTLRSHKKQS